VLQAVVNGYSDGLISVPAVFSGTQEAPISTTACRYGDRSGGPFCGTIVAKGVQDLYQGIVINNMTKVSGSCTDDGDSGGPFLTAAGQIQGTNVGGAPGSVNTCPVGAPTVYFVPIDDHINAFANDSPPIVQVLTSHGANPPSVGSITCFQGGVGLYVCALDSYQSQGVTDFSWTTSTGQSSSGLSVTVICTPPQLVSVNVDVTNVYGASTGGSGFVCQAGPPS
jgi:hypothetical protein